jgi:dipeptidyl-peptidase-4
MTDPPPPSPPADSFPRQQARTRRFSLGAPRTFSVSPDGSRVLFLRSAGPEDPVTGLWVYDVGAGEERQIAGVDGDGNLTSEERDRRERARETAGGIVSYATDRDHLRAVFAVSGELWVAEVLTGQARALRAPGPVFDPRLDPTGRWVAYCCDGALRVMGADGNDDRLVAGDDNPDVSWGQAEFVAAEEMGRNRGFWWAPDGSALLVTRVDETPVGVWWIADPAHPERPARPHRYPAAGGADASVTLHRVSLDAATTQVVWDRDRYPYLVRVSWSSAGPPLLVSDPRVCPPG